MVGAERAQEQVAIYNIGSLDRLNVQGIADIVVKEMGLPDVRYDWTGGVKGGRGWVGDVKEMLLDIKKLQAIGWNPRYGQRSGDASSGPGDTGRQQGSLIRDRIDLDEDVRALEGPIHIAIYAPALSWQ